jgi:hypothetical protein
MVHACLPTCSRPRADKSALEEFYTNPRATWMKDKYDTLLYYKSNELTYKCARGHVFPIEKGYNETTMNKLLKVCELLERSEPTLRCIR